MLKFYVYKKEELKTELKKMVLTPLLYKSPIENNYIDIPKEVTSFPWYELKHEKVWGKDYKYPESIEFVSDPAGADFIIYPYILDEVYQEYIAGDKEALNKFFNTVPLLKQYEEKHVFISYADTHSLKTNLKSVFFKASVNKTCKDKNEYAIPYMIPDFGELTHYKENRIKYQFNFTGCDRSNAMRLKLVKALEKSKLTKNLKIYDNFFYNKFQNSEEVTKLMEQYRIDTVDSLVTICPIGKGMNTIRFFETMMLGRVPILISDDVELPFENMINYNDCVITIPEKSVDKLDDELFSIFDKYSEDELLEMGEIARSKFEFYFKANYAVLEMLWKLIDVKSFNNKLKRIDLLNAKHDNSLTSLNEVIGWMFTGDMVLLYDKASLLPAGAKVLEVGSHRGLSSYIMADVLKYKNGSVKCVDLWDNEEYHEEFKNNVLRMGNRQYINHLKGDSKYVLKYMNEQFDLIFIDGDHTYSGCLSDIELSYKLLKPGCEMLLHDGVEDSDVFKAANDFCSKHKLKLEKVYTHDKYSTHGMLSIRKER